MTQREKIEALERELAELRAQVALLQRAQTIHHHHLQPTTPVSPVETPWHVVPRYRTNICSAEPLRRGAPESSGWL